MCAVWLLTMMTRMILYRTYFCESMEKPCRLSVMMRSCTRGCTASLPMNVLHFLNKKKQKNNVSLDDVAYELADTLADAAYFNGDAIQRKLQEALINAA